MQRLPTAARLTRSVRLLVCCVVLCMLPTGCHGPQSMLESAGPDAAGVVTLWWVLFGVATLVTVTVFGFLFVSCIRTRGSLRSGEPNVGLGGVLMIGGLATVVLLFALLVATYEQAQPFADEGNGGITIEVCGKLWWWSVVYYDEQGERIFETANEIRIPAATPVQLRLVSDNVIHSFWVPKLGGKMDMIPGHTNHLWIEADEPGTFRGQCAEFCGVQHAKMAFFVVALPAEEFREWIAEQRMAAVEPTSDVGQRGREVFRQAGCTRCHVIRGTSASSPTSRSAVEHGPDLTHLASRLSLAAGTLPNRRGHLGGWIADPQSVKPGSLMPPFSLPAQDFHALLHYLESLK
jgi:cytochrome c oxidase subunit II